jgi:hypothetical protein
LSVLTKRAVHAIHKHPFQAPFVIRTFDARVYPAYYVRSGVIHYGFQLVTTAKSKINLRILLCSSSLLEYRRKRLSFQINRLALFTDAGLMNPASHFDLVIRHSYPLLSKRNPPSSQWGRLDKGLSHLAPFPLHQSPIPHPDFIDTNYQVKPDEIPFNKGIVPTNISIGNLDLIKIARYLPFGDNNITWLCNEYLQNEPLPTLPATTLRELRRVPSDSGSYFKKVYNNFLLPINPVTTFCDKSTQTFGKIVLLYLSGNVNRDQVTSIEIGQVNLPKEQFLQCLGLSPCEPRRQ